MIVVLTGGTGGAKFVDGLRQIVPAKDLTIIVNTGDDLRVVGPVRFSRPRFHHLRSGWIC